MQPQPEQPAKKKTKPLYVLFGVASVALLCVVVALVGGGDEKPADPVKDDRTTYAEVMCEQFVEKRLKAPASAEYTDPKTSKAGATYTVGGSVDSQNSFGAKIRSRYVCTVKDNGDDSWTLVDLTLSK